MDLINRIINNYIKRYEIQTIFNESKIVYLTFDDGPESGITEFVLEELAKYDFKATFFCRGDNAEKYPALMDMLRKQGHSIASHTYSHLHAYNVSTKRYIDDVKKADDVLHTSLFRPPHGSLTLFTWLRLRKKYSIVYWALNSNDFALEHFNLQHSIDRLKAKTKPGDVVLFHFCHRHENETRQLLPMYLEWLYEQGYQCQAIAE